MNEDTQWTKWRSGSREVLIFSIRKSVIKEYLEEWNFIKDKRRLYHFKGLVQKMEEALNS